VPRHAADGDAQRYCAIDVREFVSLDIAARIPQAREYSNIRGELLLEVQ
jgi:hypothetical protein